MAVHVIGPDAPLPPVDHADESGLVAIGGNLGAPYLLKAYRKGLFPWNNEEFPPCWYSPNPRMVLNPRDFKLSHSMKSLLRKNTFTFQHNQSFRQVLHACASTPRHGQTGTWLHQDLQNSLFQLHLQGHAHSVEVWANQKLVGGLYTLQIGKMFFGESMFSLMPNASKAALFMLCASLPDDALIDCQQETEHLRSLGAHPIDRSAFIQQLYHLRKQPYTFQLKEQSTDQFNA